MFEAKGGNIAQVTKWCGKPAAPTGVFSVADTHGALSRLDTFAKRRVCGKDVDLLLQRDVLRGGNDSSNNTTQPGCILECK